MNNKFIRRNTIRILVLLIILFTTSTIIVSAGPYLSHNTLVHSPVTSDPIFIINNPYKGVDWATFGQYRAALHVHTTRSDGQHGLRDMVLDHYNKGFDILAITDHDTLFTGDWADGMADSLTSYERDAIVNGNFQGPFPGNFGPYLRREQENGMIWLPNTNEQSLGDIVFPHQDKTHQHDLNTFWASFNNDMDATLEENIAITSELGGIAIINHPGRYTGGRSVSRGFAASNNPANIALYAELIRHSPAIIGMEVFNRIDSDSRSDRVLWDNILMQMMPLGRQVWGFSNDDTHHMDSSGYNWNVMLMPKLSADNTRIAMESGAFYMVARVDRSLRINHRLGADPIAKYGDEDTLFLLEQQTPSISNIRVCVNLIEITGQDYDRIEWIANGRIINIGPSLNLAASRNVLNSYVRAQLISTTGVAMTQPFGLTRVRL